MRILSFYSIAFFTVLLTFTSCNKNQNSKENMKTENRIENSLFPQGEPNNPDYFTGEVYLQPLVSQEKSDGYYSAGSVTFMPGARTNWHTHPSVQTLIVIEGEGWYQEKGKDAVKLQKGSVVPIPVGVEHWHGASDGSKLVHIAITNFKDGSAVTWLSPVTDEEYNKVK